MFKKGSDVKALQRLSGADRKKLRRAIQDRFRRATDADVDVILPPKADVSVTKLANRVHVYLVDGSLPMLFEVDGQVFPTVYAMWKLPSLLPAFVLKGAEVSRYVVGGADLMFPGVGLPSGGFPPFKAGEPYAVKVPGNDFPIAVGTTTMSSSEAERAGLRGKAVRILHSYPDTLWSSAEGKYVPNAGFMEDIVIEDPSVQYFVDENITDDDYMEDVAGIQHPSIANIKVLKDLKLVNEENESEVGTSASITTEEMDLLLERCLLQALHTTVKDKDLPIPGSTLWSGHILPCRPPGSTLDIKKSSYKKLSKWLQTISSTTLISAKEDKHTKEIMLLRVNRGYPLYQNFKPTATTESPAPKSVPDAAVQPQSSFDAVEVWKPTSHVASIFHALGADTTKYYSAAEATEIAFGYVEKENLAKQDNKSVVVLDAVLCDALFKGAVKKGSSYPSEIHKRDLGATFIARMQAHHKMTRDNKSVVKKGALKCIQIVTERRQGNKKVTRVSGLELFLIDAEALAAELQKKFACSTSVAELPGKKGENEILIQGGVLEDLGKHLVQHYGIPKKYIEILDKTKK